MADYKGTIESTCEEDKIRSAIAECDIPEGRTQALLISGRNALYPMDKEEFLDNLESYVHTDGSLKLTPIKEIVGTTLNGGDINAPDLGTYGGASPTNLNARNDAFQINAGDCLYKELLKFNKRKVRIFRVDDAGRVYGTVVTQNGVDYFAGFKATLYTMRTRTDGSTSNNLSVYVYYTADNEDEEKNMQAINAGLSNIPDGLTGAYLVAQADGTVKVLTSCGGNDITEEYSTDWTPEMFVTEAGVAATSAAYNAGTKTIAITPAGSYKIASSEVLFSADIVGLDGVDIYVPVTAPAAP